MAHGVVFDEEEVLEEGYVWLHVVYDTKWYYMVL